MKTILSFMLIIALLSACSEKLNQKGSPEYINEIQQWDQKRASRLKEETGWLNLVGLFWLKDGNNTFGSAKDNDLIFSSGPEHIGSFILKDSVVMAKINPGTEVLYNGNPVTEIIMKDDYSDNTTVGQSGSLRWNVIKRTEGYAIRLRDLNAPLLNEFKGIERFPINEDWKITAKFEKYDPPKKLLIPDVFGTVGEENSPGAVVFQVNGKTYKLDALDAGGNRIWFIFADETSGEETYGAGRYLYTDKPDSNGNVILDFNTAYNPPCVFTKFATCPFPPKDNFLKLRITAGEKVWGEHA